MSKSLKERILSGEGIETTMGAKSLPEILSGMKEGADYFIIDPNLVMDSYAEIQKAFAFAEPRLAVKANSSEGLLPILHKMGSGFEIAGIGELNLCKKTGVPPEKILFSHPAKTPEAIAAALEYGVRQFVSDSVMDLKQIAAQAAARGISDVEVMVRIGTNNHRGDADDITGFDKRFGVDEDTACALLANAKDLGLSPIGIAMHVGTQQQDINAWQGAIASAANIFERAKREGMPLSTLDIGGGLPSRCSEGIPRPKEYSKAISLELIRFFGAEMPSRIYMENGRAISAMAGVTIGRVVNNKPNPKDESRQVLTLTIGRYNAGLYGVGHEVSFYKLTDEDRKLTPITSKVEKESDFYGGACASFDTPFDPGKAPEGLEAGNVVLVTGTGCYTENMSTRWCSIAQPVRLELSLDRPVVPLEADHKAAMSRLRERGFVWNLSKLFVESGAVAVVDPLAAARDDDRIQRFFKEMSEKVTGPCHSGKAGMWEDLVAAEVKGGAQLRSRL
jgi:ornithine decarboxylase